VEDVTDTTPVLFVVTVASKESPTTAALGMFVIEGVLGVAIGTTGEEGREAVPAGVSAPQLKFAATSKV
jgi:hypothetical protein